MSSKVNGGRRSGNGRLAASFLAAVILLPLAAARGQPGPGGASLRFEDAGPRSGITFRHVSGSAEKDYIFEVNGSGVALFDHDGDGDLDIYFVNGSRLDLEPGSETAGRPLQNDGGWRFTASRRQWAWVTPGGVWGGSGGCGQRRGPRPLRDELGRNVLTGKTARSRRRRRSGAGTGMTSASFGDLDRDGRRPLRANYRDRSRTARRRGDPA
jgi:hypothetical protein